MKRISIKNKLLLNSVIIIAFTITMILIGFFEFNRSKEIADYISLLDQQLVEFERLEKHFTLLEQTLDEYFFIGGESYKMRIKNIFDNIIVSVEQLEHYSYKHDLIEEIKSKSLVINKLTARLLDKEFHPISNRMYNEFVITIYSEIKSIHHLQNSYSEQTLDRLKYFIETQQKSLNKAILEFFILGSIIIIFYLIYGISLSKGITIPLLKLKNAAAEIYNGNFKIKVPINSNDEIGDLSKIFNKMAEQITEYVNHLKNSEERYRSLVETQTELVCRLKSDGTFTFVNSAFCRAFNKTREEFIGSTWQLLPVENDINTVSDKLATLSPSKPMVTIENRVVSGDGNIHWVQFVNRGFFDSHGNLSEIQSVGRDITERKQAELALQENKEFLELAIDGSNAGMWDLKFKPDDPPGEFGDEMYLSPRLKAMMGFRDYEFPGSISGFENRIVPQDLEKVKISVQEHLSGRKELQDAQYRILHKDRTIRWFHSRGKIRRDEKGRPVRWTGITWDITEQKKIEEKLQRYSNRLKVLYDIDKAILSAKTFEAIAQNTLNEIHKLIPFTRGSIIVFDFNTKTARIACVNAVKGISLSLGVGTRFPLDMFPNLEEFALGRINFFHDIKSVFFPSAKIQQLKAEGIRSYINIPMISQGKLLGSFNLGSDKLDFFTDQYVKISCEISDSLAIAMQHAHLMDEIINHQEKLKRLSAHIIIAQEAERKKISMELHDEMGQALTAITINLSSIEKKILSKISPLEKEILMDTILLAEQTVDQIHDLSLFLRPAILDDLGLVPALRWFIERYAKRSKFEIEFKTTGLDERLKESVEITIYRIIQEALNNIAKHADATKVIVRLEKKQEMIYGIIKDNGKGFNLDEVLADNGREYGIGLIGMRERLAMINADFNIESCKGQGTQITMEIPSLGKKDS